LHDTALYYGSLFFKTYVNSEKSSKILDLGSQDVNGSLRTVASKTAEYIGVDVVDGKGVDVKVTDPYKLPFEDNFFDAAVSSSSFEHTEFFWLSFLELLRVLKPEGLLYINAPSNGSFHRYPVDCWRFYPDSGIALVNWAHRNGLKETALLESFVGDQKNDKWNDFVAVFIKSKKHISAYKKRMTSSFSFGFSNAYLIGSEEVLNFKDQSFDQLLINKQKEEIHNLSSSLSQRTKELNQTITKKNNEIKKIINSRSFIITKPFRFLARILRGEFSLAFNFLFKIKFVTFILKKIPYKFSLKLKSYIYLKNIYKWSVEKKYFNYHFYNNKYVLNLDSWSAFKFYIEEGFLLNHNPSEKFSTILFYSFNPDLQAQKINPFLYYFFNQLECENFIEKCANLIIDENGYETPEYEPNLILNSAISHKNVPKIFAFFLPGFHEDEFNNEFWGKGFTEWDNLKKNNKPLFLGHKYPFEPYTYYNLTDEKIIREQCKLAKKSGIDGFSIFLYFFPDNKFPLYNIVPKLVEILTEEGLEFCFCWANESWSRRWDGLDQDVLIAQNKELTAKEISSYLGRISFFFKKKNYLTIDNKKYFAIYRPDYFNNSNTVVKQIKNELKKEKIDVHLSACNTFLVPKVFLNDSEYDSITEYPPHPQNENIKKTLFQKINNKLTVLHCYKKFFLNYVRYINSFKYKKRVFRTIIPSWDNTPRKGKNANLFINYSSLIFNKFLSTVLSDEMKNNEKDKVIFINSWNEWGEGANIEPDKNYGYWKLNCISRVKNNFITSELHDSKSANTYNNDNIRLALVHVFFLDDFQYLLQMIKKYNNINFFVTVPKFIFNFEPPNLKNLIIKTTHNDERDFNVLYQSRLIMNLNKFKIISKIHFKRRDQVSKKKINIDVAYRLVEDQLKINSILKESENNKFICKSDWVFENQIDTLFKNEYFLKKLCDNFKYDYSELLKNKFASGGLWTILDNSSAYIDFINNIDYSNFQLDSGGEDNDGYYCHALERLCLFHFQKKSFQLEFIEDYL
jgi:SAM-dependent methyltransferase